MSLKNLTRRSDAPAAPIDVDYDREALDFLYRCADDFDEIVCELARQIAYDRGSDLINEDDMRRAAGQVIDAIGSSDLPIGVKQSFAAMLEGRGQSARR